MNSRRLKKIFVMMATEKIPCAATCGENDIFYFTGLKVSGCFLVFFRGKASLFVNSLYPLKAPWIRPLGEMKKLRPGAVFADPGGMTVLDKARLEKALGVRVRSSNALFLRARAVKEPDEIKKLAGAQRISKKIMGMLRPAPGITEEHLARRIGVLSARFADGPSFEPIAAFGKNTAFPHHCPDGRAMRAGTHALVDLGVKKDGYCGDLTRIKGLSNIEKSLKRALNALRGASKTALENIRPGVSASSVDRLVREYLAGSGYEKNILHSTGHGIGLDVHEWPPIAAGAKAVFEKGMVFTIEPGLYFDGVGGVREENVYVLGDRPEELG